MVGLLVSRVPNLVDSRGNRRNGAMSTSMFERNHGNSEEDNNERGNTQSSVLSFFLSLGGWGRVLHSLISSGLRPKTYKQFKIIISTKASLLYIFISPSQIPRYNLFPSFFQFFSTGAAFILKKSPLRASNDTPARLSVSNHFQAEAKYQMGKLRR